MHDVFALCLFTIVGHGSLERLVRHRVCSLYVV